jgi:predicted Ser/Thr protein kinase
VEPAPALPQSLGDFHVQGILGVGGSGTVYDATWGPRRVALKVLHAELVATGKDRAQFLAEARRLQQIGHPSVIKVLAVGELPDGRPYLAMERLEGEPLASAIARGALPLALALQLFDELCGAVSALHAQGLVHRDLKPENVFVVDGRHAVLLDFGIAKDLAAPASTTTQEGNVRGTPAYMAPERFFGQGAGIATDIYELALVLYAMLAGRLPWSDVVDPEARLAPRPLVELAQVPDALDVAIRRALSTRAQNRPASATALLATVREAASGSGAEPGASETARMRPGVDAVGATVLAPQPTPLAWAPTQPATTTKRPQHRARWLYAALAFAVVAAAGTVAYVHGGHEPAARTAIVATPVPGTIDPWGSNALHVAGTAGSTIETPHTDEPRLPPAAYRAELAAAIGRLPGDTRVIVAVEIRELLALKQTSELLAKAATWPKLQTAIDAVPACIQMLVKDGEWFAFGTTSTAALDTGTFVVRGKWTRAGVEACLAKANDFKTADDGTKLWEVETDAWLDFIDDHTAYVSFRTGTFEDVHKARLHPVGPPSHTREVLAKLPAERTFAFVADGRAKDTWDTPAIPKGSDVYGWIRVDRGGLVVDASADPHAEADATLLVDTIKPKVDEVFGMINAETMGKVDIDRKGTVAHLHGTLTVLMLEMLANR